MDSYYLLGEYIGLITISIISNIIAIIVSGVLADKKGRNVGGWIVGGIFLSWIAVISLACLEDLSLPVPSYSSASAKVKRCPQCNEIIKLGACEMCGYRDNTYRSVKQTKKIRVEQKTVPSYQCASCGETVNTSRCPYCGWEKK